MVRLVLVLLGVFCLACLAQCKPPVPIPPLNPNDPAKLPDGVNRNVLIIGGGLAGLSAALELADRGYNVTIKEQNVAPGGKLRTVPVNLLDQTFFVEHGFHAWFYNYFQFKDIRDRLNINDNFRVWPKVHFVYRNYKPEILYSEGPYPLNLLGIISRSPNLKLSDAILSSLSLPDMVFYNFSHIYQKYDDISFHQWAKEKHVAQDFYDIIMQPSLSVTLNDRANFSAAEMLTFMQIYFLSNSDSDHREVTKVNYYQAILKPWTDYLKKLKVTILYNTTVDYLTIDSNCKVTGSADNGGIIDSTQYQSVVMAADVGSVQNILSKTYSLNLNKPAVRQALDQSYNNSIGRMKIAPDYKVLRLWFDKQLNSSAPDILETPDFTPINLIAQYHLLEEEFSAWANKTGGSVMEFHCYTWSNHFDPHVDDSKVWGLISPIVKQIYPEIFLRKFNVLAYHVNSYQNFASFELGLTKYRPRTTVFSDAKIDNMFIAGDWIFTNFPSALMERAVSTGRLAANEILIRDHVKQAPLLVVNSKGPGL